MIKPWVLFLIRVLLFNFHTHFKLVSKRHDYIRYVPRPITAVPSIIRSEPQHDFPSLSEATVRHSGQQRHQQGLQRDDHTHGAVLVVLKVTAMPIAGVARLAHPAKVTLREAAALDQVTDDAHKALIVRVVEPAKLGRGHNLLAAGRVDRTAALVAVKSVLRKYRSVAPALIRHVMAQLALGFAVAVCKVFAAQR
uniref:(northern house mosquito) hypothetical protein n=1 Tax=Culex pipiens TaxID=7175 RepID=A0A8D8B701_CULPI